jgi:uncharacterized protein YukE
MLRSAPKGLASDHLWRCGKALVSISLPHWFAEVIGILGFQWPEIDEDQLVDAGRYLREYADHSSVAMAAHGRQIADLGQQYDGQSYASLAAAWSNQSHGNMESLVQGCHLMAGGMDLAADGVVAMKGKVLVQLGIAAAEIVAVQAAAVATVGAAEAAMPALIAAQNRILNGILNEFAAEVVVKLVGGTIGPLTEQVEHAVNKLVYEQISEQAGVSNTLKVDPGALREQAAQITARAEESQRAGWDLSRKLDNLQFLTAG